jgi:hypothetical protein
MIQQMETMTETTYRLLPSEEWERLKPIFQQNGAAMPRPEIATAAIAEQRGEIVGMLIMQYAIHAEPLWIKESERGKVSWKKLLNDVAALLPKGSAFYVFAPNEQIAHMARASGMEELAWKPFLKEVK